jgi:hypothetical protein
MIVRKILRMIDIWSVKRTFKFTILILDRTKLSKYSKGFSIKISYQKPVKFSQNQKFMTFNFLKKSIFLTIIKLPKGTKIAKPD